MSECESEDQKGRSCANGCGISIMQDKRLCCIFWWSHVFCGFGLEAVTDGWALTGICGQLFCYTFKFSVFSELSHTKAAVRSQGSMCLHYLVFI